MVGFVDTHDNMKNFDQKFAGKDPGPYVGKVKFTNDPLRQGRLGVNIPDLSQTNDPGPDDCIWCQYLSPFYGAKSIEANDKSDPDSYKGTQHTYGMWFVPPDIDTEVLVIFAKGELSKKNAFWIGCVQQPLTNQQVPGYGASTFTELASDRSTARERAITANASGQTQDYGTDLLPVGERNRRLIEGAVSAESANSFRYPVNRILADQMSAQGLIQDPVRGTTTSSAKREAPSQVFGINTPGRIREDSRSLNIGPGGAPVRPDRNPGHSFVMDDGAEDGSNQLTRLRTASGHQILMHDTEGTVYIANGSGKAFIEMEKDGTVSVFSDGGINMRTKQDFNLHSDRHVNFHAKGSLNFTAEQNVNLNGGFNVQTMAKNSILNSSQGDLRSYAGTVLSSFSAGTQLHGAGGNIDLAGSQVHMNSQGASSGWGPSWLVPEHERVGIKLTGGEVTDGDAALIDIDSRRPLQGGEANKIANKTTVSDFVTHEPYTRTSSTAIRKRYINQILESIESGNPGMSSQDLDSIRKRLLSKDSIDSVLAEVNKIVSVTSDKVSNFASTEIKKLVGDNTKLDLSQLNSIQKLLVKPNIADISGEIRKIVGNSVNLDLSQLNNVKINLLNHPDVDKLKKQVSGYAEDIVGLSETVELNIAAFNELKNKAKNYKNEIKNAASGFIQGVVSKYSTAAFNYAKEFVKSFTWSDSRLKDHIRLVGKSPMGINIYSFKYKQSAGTYEGVMAQEVPWARQMTDTGFYMVDYSKVDVEFRRVN